MSTGFVGVYGANASPRSKVACGKSRDKLIERATLHIVRTTEMGPRALVLALLPTAVAALRHNDKGTELGPIVGGTAGVLIFLFVIYHKWYKYRTRSTTVTAPAGKAGLLFDETATPPTVTGLAALSPLRGEVQVGWKLATVDDVDVSTMTGAAATRLLEERAVNARRLEFDRTLAAPPGPPVGA